MQISMYSIPISWPKSKHINSLFATFADLHVRKHATFAILHSLHTPRLFIRIAQWSDYHCFWFALCACVINVAFWGGFPYDLQVKNIQRVENSTSKMAPQYNVAYGRLYVARVNGFIWVDMFHGYNISNEWMTVNQKPASFGLGGRLKTRT